MKALKTLMTSLLFLLPMQLFAEVAVVVSKDSPISTISESRLRQVYLEGAGQVDGQRVSALDLAENDRVRERFYKLAVGKTPAGMKSYWARMIFTGRGAPPRSVSSVSEMHIMLENNPSMIGYLPADKVSDKLKVLRTLD